MQDMQYMQDIPYAFQLMQESSITPREGTAAKYLQEGGKSWIRQCGQFIAATSSKKSIKGSQRENNDENIMILSRSSKFKSIEGVLVKSKIYLVGNFNVNLSNLT